MKRTMFVLGAALAMAGCQKQADVKAPAAGGEVLPGSVSDAMLDTDRSQAQAPVLAATPTSSAKAVKSEAAPAAEATGDASVGLDATVSATPEAKPSEVPALKSTVTAKPKPKPSAN